MNAKPDEKPAETPEAVIGSQLANDERLIWCGRAGRNAYTRSNPFRAIFGRIVFIIGCVAIYFAAEAMAANPRSPGAFGLLFGIVLAIFGFGLAIRPFWHWWTAESTFYGVTDRRALIVRTRPWFKGESFSPIQLLGVQSETYADGTGSVIFANEPFGRLRGLRAAVGFWGVEKPERAAAALQVLYDQTR